MKYEVSFSLKVHAENVDKAKKIYVKHLCNLLGYNLVDKVIVRPTD